jgi:hypothetical protein
MINIAFASLIILAGTSHAQLVTPTAAGRAWSGPVVGTISNAGLDAVNGLGRVSLSRLAMPDADGAIPAFKTPTVLAPLIAELVQIGHSPETFAAHPTAAQLAILAFAAKSAEDKMSARAAALAKDAASGVKRSNATALLTSAAEVREMAVYLDSVSEKNFAAAEQAIQTYHTAHVEAVRAFLEDLPSKMAAGQFDGKTLLLRDDEGDGWRTADGAPDEIFATPGAALAARVDEVVRMPAGPWSVAEAALLTDALAAAVAKGQVSDSAWIDEMSRRLTAAKERGEVAAVAGMLGRAAANLKKNGRLNGAQINAIEKYYSDSILRHDIRLDARILATIQTGGAGLPGWPTFQAARTAFIARMDALARRAGIGWVVAVVSVPFLVSPELSRWGLAAFVAAWMSPVGVFIWALWQRDTQNFHWKWDYLGSLMDRYFRKNDSSVKDSSVPEGPKNESVTGSFYH